MMEIKYGASLKVNNIKVFQLETKMEDYLIFMEVQQIKELNLLFGIQMDKQIKHLD